MSDKVHMKPKHPYRKLRQLNISKLIGRKALQTWQRDRVWSRMLELVKINLIPEESSLGRQVQVGKALPQHFSPRWSCSSLRYPLEKTVCLGELIKNHLQLISQSRLARRLGLCSQASLGCRTAQRTPVLCGQPRAPPSTEARGCTAAAAAIIPPLAFISHRPPTTHTQAPGTHRRERGC